MDHQSFRFYIPGIVFLTPIYFVTCWITIHHYTDSDIRIFVLVGGITTFPVIALPIGWLIYNAYRVWWLKLTKGGYENKDFVKLIRQHTKPFYSSLMRSVLIDFSHIKGIESWIKIDVDLFRKTFSPFTEEIKFKEEIRQIGIQTRFSEPLSDFILWKDSAYDYARSISSVRYGLESSLFALVLGGFYALALQSVWLYELHQTSNVQIFFIAVASLFILTIIFLTTLFIRWSSADKEYDARLLLITITSMRANYFNTNFFTDKIPKDIVEKINRLSLGERSYAAFDLDNTLLIDDIGEAVFAELVKRKIIQGFDWKDYLNLIQQDREVAYKKVIQAMSGVKLSILKKITREIICSSESQIEIGEHKVALPKPNPVMQHIVSFLKTKGIDVYVVTASNSISAEIICWEYFGIPSTNVFGAEVSVDRTKNITYFQGNLPYGEGKVKILKEKFKDKPIVTGGDGIWDKFLLDYTESDGMRLWLGNNREEYKKIKSEHYDALDFYHIHES